MKMMGNTIHPYAIADLHGEITLLQKLLRTIPATDVQLIFLGNYVDRGEDSFKTIQFLRELAHERSCIFLRGNHDAAWLDTWSGERFLRCPAIPGARALWEQVNGQIPPTMGQFLTRTQIDWEDRYAYYSHAGARPKTSFRQTPAEVKVWGDDLFLTSTYDWGKPVIFGHYEVAEPLITHTKIGIDTAAYRSGTLTALDVINARVIQVIR